MIRMWTKKDSILSLGSCAIFSVNQQTGKDIETVSWARVTLVRVIPWPFNFSYQSPIGVKIINFVPG